MAVRARFVVWCGLAAVAASGLFTGCGGDSAPVTAEKSKFRPADSVKQEKEVGLPPAETPQGLSIEADELDKQAKITRGPGGLAETVATDPATPKNAASPPGEKPSDIITEPGSTEKEITVSAEVKQMVVMIRELAGSAPPGNTEQEQIQNLLKQQYLIVELASRILQSNSPMPVYSYALENGSQALQTLGQIGDPSARTRMSNFATVVSKHPNAEIARQGRLMLFDSSMATQLDTDKVDGPAVLKEVENLLSTDAGDQQVLALTSAVCQMLGERGHKVEAAKGMRAIAAAYKDNKDAQLAELGKMQESAANLLDVDVPKLLLEIRDKKPEAESNLYDAIKDLVKGKNPSPAYLQAMIDIITRLERGGHNELVLKFYDLLDATYGAHENPEVSKFITRYVAQGRKRFDLIGKPFTATAVSFESPEKQGQELDLKPYEGKVLLVNFWGTFVGPSLRELPILREVHEKLQPQGLEVVSLMLDTDLKAVERFFTYQKKSVPWTTYLSPDVVKGEQFEDWHDTSLAKDFGLFAAPFYVLVNKEGNVDSIHHYQLDSERMAERLTELLELKEPFKFVPPPLTIENNTIPKAAPTPTEAPAPPATPAAPPAEPKKESPPENEQGSVSPRWSPAAIEQQLALLFSPAGLFSVVAAEDAPASKAETEKKDVIAADANPYLAKPGLKASQLTDWVLRMLDKPKTIQARPGFAAAIVDACDRVLADKEAKETEQLIAIENKLAVLHAAACAGNEEADKQLAAFVDQLKDDARPRVTRETKFFVQERKVLDAADPKPEELAALLKELQEFYAKEKLASKHLRMASATVDLINKLEDGDAREKHFSEFGQVFAKSSDKELARYGKKLAKKPETKESDLVGKPLELAGNTAAGLPFAWDKYRGKVVIVDFWATWCGPCKREMPHVKALHEKLKDKGFEVVGVSVDKDLEALETYLDENEIPWETLAGDEAGELAEKYGVRGIPTMMLVDQKGNVVAVAHNIAALAPQAEKLLEK